MKITKRFLFLLAVIGFAQIAKTQSVDDIIAKHLNAIGGKEKLATINSIRFDNTMQVMGSESQGTTTIVNGKGYRNESDFSGMQMVQVVTDKSGWAINPMGGGSAEPMPDAMYKMFADQVYIFPLLDYSSHGAKAEMLGQAKVGEANTYKISLTSKDNVTATYFIDANTYYIVQTVKPSEMMGNPIEVITSYSEYKPTDAGIVLPQSTEMNLGGQFSLTSKLKKAEVNVPVDEAVFEMK